MDERTPGDALHLCRVVLCRKVASTLLSCGLPLFEVKAGIVRVKANRINSLTIMANPALLNQVALLHAVLRTARNALP
jgi:hypothetical protein